MPKQLLTQSFIDRSQPNPDARKLCIHDTKVTGLSVEIRHTGKTYHLHYTDSYGRQKQKALGSANILTLADARSEAIKYLRDIHFGLDPFSEKEVKKNVPTCGEFIADSYLPHAKSYKRSWETDECLLRNHIIPAIGHLHLDEVKRHHMVTLFTKHRETHAAGSTNRIIILSRYLFNCAIKWEVDGIEKNPTAGIDLLPENNKIERFITEDEAHRLFKAVDQSDNSMLKYIVSLLLLTGARKREVLDARWEDFDLTKRIWTIRFNKTGKPRHVPLSDGVLAVLQQIPFYPKCEWLVPNPKTGKPYVSIFGAWDTARKRAGLDEVRIHDLRHSFASFLINSGRSLYEVQKILGHTQVKTTQRYAHLSQDTLIDAANTAIAAVPLAMAMPTTTNEINLIEAK